MNQDLTNDLFYTMCIAHLRDIEQSVLTRSTRTREEGAAVMHLVSHLFNLAAGAAVVRGYENEITSELMRIVKNIEERLEWNA